MNCQFCLAPLHKGPCQSWETGLAGNRNKQQKKVAGKAASPSAGGARSGKTSTPTRAPARTPAPAKVQPAHQPQVSVKTLLDEAKKLDKAGNKAGAEKLRKTAFRVREANNAARSKRAYRRREAERAAIKDILKKPLGS